MKKKISRGDFLERPGFHKHECGNESRQGRAKTPNGPSGKNYGQSEGLRRAKLVVFGWCPGTLTATAQLLTPWRGNFLDSGGVYQGGPERSAGPASNWAALVARIAGAVASNNKKIS